MDKQHIINKYIESRQLELQSKKEMVARCVYSDVPEDIMDYILLLPDEVDMDMFNIYIGATDEWFYLAKNIWEKIKITEMLPVFIQLVKNIAVEQLHPADEYAVYVEEHDDLNYGDICQIRNRIEAQRRNKIFQVIVEFQKCNEQLKGHIHNIPSYIEAEQELQKYVEENADLKNQLKDMEKNLKEKEVADTDKKKKLFSRSKNTRGAYFLMELMIQKRFSNKEIEAVNKALNAKVPIRSLIAVVEKVGDGNEEEISLNSVCEYMDTLISLKKA